MINAFCGAIDQDLIETGVVYHVFSKRHHGVHDCTLFIMMKGGNRKASRKPSLSGI
jgi:hypothetical protein